MMKMLQGQVFSLAEILQGLWTEFLTLGAVLGFIAFVITVFKFYFDYLIGSNVKILEAKEILHELVMHKEITKEGDTQCFVNVPISFIFSNEGNKTGIIDKIITKRIAPLEVSEKSISRKTKLPLIIKARDCSHYYFVLKWSLDCSTAMQIINNETELKLPITVKWRRTVHTGILKNKITFEDKTNNFNISVKILGLED